MIVTCIGEPKRPLVGAQNRSLSHHDHPSWVGYKEDRFWVETDYPSSVGVPNLTIWIFMKSSGGFISFWCQFHGPVWSNPLAIRGETNRTHPLMHCKASRPLKVRNDGISQGMSLGEWTWPIYNIFCLVWCIWFLFIVATRGISRVSPYWIHVGHSSILVKPRQNNCGGDDIARRVETEAGHISQLERSP